MGRQAKKLDKLSAKVYENLSARDRLRTVLEHYAMGDNEEAKRVWAAAPKVTYTGVEHGLDARLRAALALALQFSAEIHDFETMLAHLPLLNLELSQQVLLARGGWRELEIYAGLSALLPPPPRRMDMTHRPLTFTAVLQHPVSSALHVGAYVPLLKFAKLKWRAFDACCQEHIGVDGRTLLKACAGAKNAEWPEWLEAELKRLEMSESEPFEVDGVKKLTEHYGTLFRNIEKEEKDYGKHE